MSNIISAESLSGLNRALGSIPTPVADIYWDPCTLYLSYTAVVNRTGEPTRVYGRAYVT